MSFSCTDSSESITLHLSDRLSFRLYRANKPNCLETAPLQKGLVLVFDDEELIEEGIGFGVPVVKYKDKTYFSSSAQVSMRKDGQFYVLEKQYTLDAVSRKRFFEGYVNDGFYSVIHKLFEKAYLGHNTLAPFNNKLMELRQTLKIKTEFCKVNPRGTITSRYLFEPNSIQTTIDISNLQLQNCLEILVLNEQGASNFQNYSDSNGIKLSGNKIGAWNAVKAKEASLTNANGTLAFTLESWGSTTLFRGWEKTKNRFSWAGLSYSLHPACDTFNYRIKVSHRKN